MSGEAGGILVGGAIALAIAPVVIAGAAAIGVAYGTIRLGGVLGKHALQYAAEQKREKELAVGSCSAQLDSLYSQMRSVVREEANESARLIEEMSQSVNQIGMKLKSECDRPLSADELEKKLSISRSTVATKINEESVRIRNSIISNGRKKLTECIKVIEKCNAEKAELIKWGDKTTVAIELQKVSSKEMLRDAEASYKVIESMAKSTRDISFINQVETIFSTLQRSKTMMEEGLYQGAFSNARTVVRECALIASDHVQKEIEVDMMKMELCAKIEGLIEEMKAQRFFEFVDETKKNKKLVKVDLNNFSQGEYNVMLDSLQELLTILSPNSDTESLYEISQFVNRFEKELEPKARHIIEYSQRIMKGYYDRLHVLEVVADFMTEQDYKMDWAMPVGGDASQKLVVHFVQKLTGSTISITLDNDVDSNNIAEMAMEILTFYESGRPVTESEKSALREHLNAALNKAGISGQLVCQGKVNQSSNQIEMDRKESVRNMQIKRIIQNS